MKICNFDFIFLFILVFIAIFIYDLVKSIIISSEGFQNISQLYQADINSIRNLLGIVPSGTPDDILNIGSNVNISGATTMNNSIVTNRLAIGSDTLIKGKTTIGNSYDGTSSTITDSGYDTNSLCIIGQGIAPNRKITMWDNVQIKGTLSSGTINNIGDINTGGDVVFSGDNKWIIHTPDDKRKTLYIAPWKDDIKLWDWNNQIRIEPNGVIYAKGFEKY